MTRKKHWACHLTQQTFTGGTIASSYAESTGSAEGRWFQKPRSTLLEVFTACFEKEQFEIRNEETLLADVITKASHGVTSDPPFVAQCRNMYSGHVTELVLAEVIDSANYSAFLSNSSRGFADKVERGSFEDDSLAEIEIVVKRNINTEKQRTVRIVMLNNEVESLKGCDCPKVVNCGHPCRHIFSACVLLCTQFSVQISFDLLKHFFNDRYLLKRNVQFAAKNASNTTASISSTQHCNENEEGAEFQPSNEDENATSHFASQLAPPPSQTQKGGRLGHVSFDKLRSEVIPVCQLGSRNNQVGNGLLRIFKSLHTSILGMSPEEQRNATAASLLAACLADLQTGPTPARTFPPQQEKHTESTRHSGTSGSNLACVVADHAGLYFIYYCCICPNIHAFILVPFLPQRIYVLLFGAVGSKRKPSLPGEKGHGAAKRTSPQFVDGTRLKKG